MSTTNTTKTINTITTNNMSSWSAFFTRTLISCSLLLEGSLAEEEKVHAKVASLHLRPASVSPPKLPSDVTVERIDVTEWPLYRVRASAQSPQQNATTATSPAPPRDAMLIAHGGGWIFEAAPMHWKFAVQVVRETDLEVLIPVYPLVPRPVATARQIVDGFFEIIRLLDTSGENRVVSIMGHSAGGTIAMAIAQQLPHFSAGLVSYFRPLILMAPMLDCAVDHPEALRIVQRNPTGQIAFGRVLAKLWAADLGVAHPHASPLFCEIDKLPPLLLLCGTDDLLVC